MANASDITVQQDAGTPEQLPQGAATDLNAALPNKTVQPAGEQPGAVQPEAMPEPAQARDYEPEYAPESDDEQFITGPTMRADEPLTAGVTAVPKSAVPASVLRHLPDLVEAAAAPGAPARLRFLVQFLAREANK